MNLFYRILVNNLATSLNLKLEEGIKILLNYNKIKSSEVMAIDEKGHLFPTNNTENNTFNQNEFYVKRVKGNKEIYDLFFCNLHIHLSKSDTENIISVRLKKNEDEWVFKKDDEKIIDFSHPINQTYEIYVWYEVPVLDITKSTGYLYKNGTWDSYFYKTMSLFLKSVEETTDNSQFNEAYKQ